MSIVTLNLHSFVEIEKQAQDIIDKKAGNKPTEDTELVSLSWLIFCRIPFKLVFTSENKTQYKVEGRKFNIFVYVN